MSDEEDRAMQPEGTEQERGETGAREAHDAPAAAATRTEPPVLTTAVSHFFHKARDRAQLAQVAVDEIAAHRKELKRQQWTLTKQMKAEKRRRKALTRRAEHLTKDDLFEVLAFRMTGPHANRYLSELAAAHASDGASSETPKTAAAASDAP